MSEATLILPNMRGGCATVGTTVHTLFRVSGRRHLPMVNPAEGAKISTAELETVVSAAPELVPSSFAC